MTLRRDPCGTKATPASTESKGREEGPTAAAAGNGEAVLVSRLKAGDETAFAALVRAEGGRMLRVARRLLRNQQEAEDAVQDAFVSAFRSMDGFEAAAKLSTWLHRIVVNAALKKIRSRQPESETSIDDMLPRFKENGDRVHADIEWTESLDDALDRKGTREKVRAAIDRLPTGYRTVMILRDIEGFDTEETARLLGIQANNVKIRLHRARLALRDLLVPVFSSAGAVETREKEA